MHKVRFLKVLACGIAAASLGAASMAHADVVPAPPFKPAVMASMIESTMAPQVVGFGYSIAQNGKPVKEDGDGNARISIDGLRSHGPFQRNNIASVSKTFTALAIMQLIEANKGKGVTADTKIGAYLPEGWTAGANVADLSFSEIMQHRTGFSSGNINSMSRLGYEAVKTAVAAGTTARPRGGGRRPFAYDNVNYALLRELMPKLWAQTGEVVLTPPKYLEAYPTYGEYTSAMYLKYLQLKIFDPIGIKSVGCADSSDKATLYYPLNPSVSGVIGTDQSLFCGSGGLYLSTNDMIKFLAYFFNTEQLLPAAARKIMVDRRFALDGSNSSRGLTLSRIGIVGIGSNSEGTGGTKACMMHFHDGIDAALVQNSGDNAAINPCAVLIAAYDAAWK